MDEGGAHKRADVVTPSKRDAHVFFFKACHSQTSNSGARSGAHGVRGQTKGMGDGCSSCDALDADGMRLELHMCTVTTVHCTLYGVLGYFVDRRHTVVLALDTGTHGGGGSFRRGRDMGGTPWSGFA